MCEHERRGLKIQVPIGVGRFMVNTGCDCPSRVMLQKYIRKGRT